MLKSYSTTYTLVETVEVVSLHASLRYECQSENFGIIISLGLSVNSLESLPCFKFNATHLGFQWLYSTNMQYMFVWVFQASGSVFKVYYGMLSTELQ